MIYLDHHSTTPADPRVVQAMLPYFSEVFFNPSQKLYSGAWQAQSAVELARERVAGFLGATPEQIIFTGTATEANHLALMGIAPELSRQGKTRILSLAIEHSSVLGPLEHLSKNGFTVEFLKTHRLGHVDMQDLQEKIKTHNDIGLISLAWANHEVGAIQPIQQISALAQNAGILVHTDAVQAASTQKIEFDRLGLGLLTLSAHKIYGPKGAAALVVARSPKRIRLQSLYYGGTQENGMRSGTLNVPALVGFGAATQIVQAQRESDVQFFSQLRDQLREGVLTQVGDIVENSSRTDVLPHHLNVSLQGVDGPAFFGQLKKVAVSNASACVSGSAQASPVLTRLGVSKALAKSALRFGIGRGNTAEQITTAVAEIKRVTHELRALEQQFFQQEKIL